MPIYRKVLAERSKKDIIFDKEKTVFAMWKDNNRLLVDHDYHKWKMPRFVKKEQERNEVKEFCDKNLDLFKEIYANVQSTSNEYPGISSLAFRDFCQKAKLIDK